jgi:hypothetical protein
MKRYLIILYFAYYLIVLGNSCPNYNAAWYDSFAVDNYLDIYNNFFAFNIDLVHLNSYFYFLSLESSYMSFNLPLFPFIGYSYSQGKSLSQSQFQSQSQSQSQSKSQFKSQFSSYSSIVGTSSLRSYSSNSYNNNTIIENITNISFENRFGQYFDYLEQKVTLKFMMEFYPQYIDNELFIYFINHIAPTIR